MTVLSAGGFFCDGGARVLCEGERGGKRLWGFSATVTGVFCDGSAWTGFSATVSGVFCDSKGLEATVL